MLSYPFVQEKHHKRKVAHAMEHEHIYAQPEDLHTLMEGLVAALAIVHGDYTNAPVSAEALAEFEAEAKRTDATFVRKAAEIA